MCNGMGGECYPLVNTTFVTVLLQVCLMGTKENE